MQFSKYERLMDKKYNEILIYFCFNKSVVICVFC